MSHALKLPGEATSTYLYIAAPDGEMAIALSDMSVCQRIDGEYLAANLPTLQNARVVVADTNIPAETLLWLAENCDAPLFCDPVSTVKAEKLRPILSKIHTLKPNRLEAELLSGVPIRCKEDASAAAKALLDQGIQRVFISMGADGVFAADRKQELWLQNLPGTMVNTTGCGDAYMAALVWAFIQGLELKQAALAGLAAGSVAMESAETINPAMCAEALRERMARA
jgi:pseudouridine kinase